MQPFESDPRTAHTQPQSGVRPPYHGNSLTGYAPPQQYLPYQPQQMPYPPYPHAAGYPPIPPKKSKALWLIPIVFIIIAIIGGGALYQYTDIFHSGANISHKASNSEVLDPAKKENTAGPSQTNTRPTTDQKDSTAPSQPSTSTSKDPDIHEGPAPHALALPYDFNNSWNYLSPITLPSLQAIKNDLNFLRKNNLHINLKSPTLPLPPHSEQIIFTYRNVPVTLMEVTQSLGPISAQPSGPHGMMQPPKGGKPSKSLFTDVHFWHVGAVTVREQQIKALNKINIHSFTELITTTDNRIFMVTCSVSPLTGNIPIEEIRLPIRKLTLQLLQHSKK